MFHVGMRFHVGEKVERLLADSEEEEVFEEEGEGEELRQRVHDLLHVRLLRDLRHRVLGGRQSHHRQRRRRQEPEAESEAERALPVRDAFVLSLSDAKLPYRVAHQISNKQLG